MENHFFDPIPDGEGEGSLCSQQKPIEMLDLAMHILIIFHMNKKRTQIFYFAEDYTDLYSIINGLS